MDNKDDHPSVVVFNGVSYRLMGAGRYYLSQSTSNEGRKKAKGLHVAIWEYYNKKSVPDGYEIHHKDGNCFNNSIENLEALPKHLHRTMPHRVTQKIIENMDRIRPLAAAWHSSEEGIAWHSRHGKEVALNMPDYDCFCVYCGIAFTSKKIDAKFCCDKCGENYRRKYEKGKYLYTKKCDYCGELFTASKYKPSSKERACCSKVCTNKLMHKNKGHKIN